MNFYNIIKSLSNNNTCDVFIDMDGVIANFDVGTNYDFDKKRPLLNNINTIKDILDLNIKLHILSVGNVQKDFIDKNNWLDKYAPFFDKENRHILIKENYDDLTSKEMKALFLSEFNTNNTIVVVDDDNAVLKHIKKTLDHVIVLQDSELVD